MSIAVFDVDGTLIRGNSLILAARKSNNLIELIWLFINIIPSLIAWKIGFITTKRIKEIFIKKAKICNKYNYELSQSNDEWLLIDLKKKIRKDALKRLNMHKKKGDIIILCSASLNMILEPLAKSLNVDLICTNLLKVENQWIAKINGDNCKGSEKLKRLKEIYGSIENELEVYGDSLGDKEILNAALIPHYKSFSDTPKEYPTFSITSIFPVIGIVFFIYLILNNLENFLNLEKQWDQLGINILIGEVLVAISYIIRFFRWKVLLRALNIIPPLVRDIYIWMGSFAFTATPGKTGEIIRVILLNKECNLPKIPILLALIMERITDAISVLIIICFSLNILPTFNNKNNEIFLLITIIIIGVTSTFLNQRKRINNLLIGLIRKILPNKNIKLNNHSLEMMEILMSPKIISISLFLGIFSWVLEGTSFFIILNGFDLSISWLGSIFAHTTASLIGAISFMPGGLGTTEASTIGLLSLQGVPFSIATSSTLLIRIMTLWFATILGLICLILNSHTKKKNITSSNESIRKIN